MKKLIITCALVSIGSMVSFAQASHSKQTSTSASAPTTGRQAPTPEQAAELRAKKYQKDLGLNAEQYKGVYEAQLEFIRQDRDMRANGQPGPGQTMQLQMMLDQRFQAAMTPEQYAKYEKTKAPAKTN